MLSTPPRLELKLSEEHVSMRYMKSLPGLQEARVRHNLLCGVPASAFQQGLFGL